MVFAARPDALQVADKIKSVLTFQKVYLYLIDLNKLSDV